MDLAVTICSSRKQNAIVIHGMNMEYTVTMEEILCVENNLRNTIYRMQDGSRVTGVRRTGSFEKSVGEIASSVMFAQPHKSYFVNLRYVSALRNDTILMDDGSEIPVSRAKMQEVRMQYFKYLKGAADE